MIFRSFAGITLVGLGAMATTMLIGTSGQAKGQQPLSTAFIYQGELAEAGAPATGAFDIRFRLYDAASGGNQIGGTLCSDNLAVIAGQFAASLDFGAVFAGQKRWLEIEVRVDTGLDCSDASGYTVLTPRQELTAAPNATFAQTASTATTASNAASLNGQSASFYQNAANLTGTLADSQLSSNVARLDGNQTFTGLLNFTNTGNTFAGSGAGLTNLNGASINAGTLARSSLTADVQSGVGALVNDLSPKGSIATNNAPISLAVVGSFAYVGTFSSNTLQVFNISNPAAPALAGSVAASRPVALAVAGSFVYVANFQSSTLQVFNVSNPTAPALAGSVATGSGPRSVAVSNSFAYVVNSNSNTLQVFNISNPAAPALMGSIATGIQPLSVVVSGSFAYVANGSSNTLQIFDISNPAAPTLTGSVATGLLPDSVTVSASFAYVVNLQSSTLQVFNISNPAAPSLMGSIATATGPQCVAVSGSLAYVTNSLSTLQVFNVSNPATPTLVGSVTTGSDPRCVVVSGASAYVVNNVSNTLQVFKALAIGFGGTTLDPSSLAGVNGSGLTGVNATQLNGQTASFYTNASNITTGTLGAAQIPNLDASKITTGTLANARTTGDNLNTPGALVLRDTSGNFSAGTITAALNGNAATATTATTATNAANLNNQPASFYQPTILDWWIETLPTITTQAATGPFPLLSTTLPFNEGWCSVNWSISAYTSNVNTAFRFRIVIGARAGPWTKFYFNTAGVHTTIGGAARIFASTGDSLVRLEVERIIGTGTISIDMNDSLTVTIINVRQ